MKIEILSVHVSHPRLHDGDLHYREVHVDAQVMRRKWPFFWVKKKKAYHFMKERGDELFHNAGTGAYVTGAALNRALSRAAGDTLDRLYSAMTRSFD